MAKKNNTGNRKAVKREIDLSTQLNVMAKFNSLPNYARQSFADTAAPLTQVLRYPVKDGKIHDFPRVVKWYIVKGMMVECAYSNDGSADIRPVQDLKPYTLFATDINANLVEALYNAIDNEPKLHKENLEHYN